MKRAIRKAGALCVFTAILAGMVFAPRFTFAFDFNANVAPRNLQVERGSDNTVTVSWDRPVFYLSSWGGAPRDSAGNPRVEYWISLHTSPIPIDRHIWPNRVWNFTPQTNQCRDRNRIVNGYPRFQSPPRGCIRRNLTLIKRAPIGFAPNHDYPRESVIVSGLAPEITYYVHVAQAHYIAINVSPRVYSFVAKEGVTTTITTESTPEPETPTTPDPETPTEPETPTTPDPETPDCTYKHRLIGVPGTTGGGYTSQILISSEASNATATIRAYQNSNGHQIDVLSDGSAIGSSVSLAPANSVKVFRLEEIRGWHFVIVEHPSKAAMENATVAMRLREPDTGISIVPAQGIEHCTTTATTTE